MANDKTADIQARIEKLLKDEPLEVIFKGRNN
jgi:hypothetical protein